MTICQVKKVDLLSPLSVTSAIVMDTACYKRLYEKGLEKIDAVIDANPEQDVKCSRFKKQSKHTS
jgi:hypothetical protein